MEENPDRLQWSLTAEDSTKLMGRRCDAQATICNTHFDVIVFVFCPKRPNRSRKKREGCHSNCSYLLCKQMYQVFWLFNNFNMHKQDRIDSIQG